MIRPLIKDILAADRLDNAFFSFLNRHAEPVALDQTPPLVSNRIGSRAGIERRMDGARKIFQLGPKRLPVGKMAELMAL